MNVLIASQTRKVREYSMVNNSKQESWKPHHQSKDFFNGYIFALLIIQAITEYDIQISGFFN